MGNINIHPSRNISLTRFIKIHEYHSWQNYSFCRDNQAQGGLTTKPSWTSPAHTQMLAAKGHVSWPAEIQYNWTARALSHQVQTCLNQIRKGHVSLKSWIFPSQAEIPSFLMWHKAEMDVTENWESSANCPFFLLQPSWSKIKSNHDQAIKAPEATWNQLIFILKMCIL